MTLCVQELECVGSLSVFGQTPRSFSPSAEAWSAQLIAVVLTEACTLTDYLAATIQSPRDMNSLRMLSLQRL